VYSDLIKTNLQESSVSWRGVHLEMAFQWGLWGSVYGCWEERLQRAGTESLIDSYWVNPQECCWKCSKYLLVAF